MSPVIKIILTLTTVNLLFNINQTMLFRVAKKINSTKSISIGDVNRLQRVFLFFNAHHDQIG